MSKPSKEVFGGSEFELASMTRDLDELHHDVGIPAMEAGVSNMIDAMERAPRQTSRRTFLMGTGAAIAGGAALVTVGGMAPSLAGAATRGERKLSAAAFPPAGLKG